MLKLHKSPFSFPSISLAIPAIAKATSLISGVRKSLFSLLYKIPLGNINSFNSNLPLYPLGVKKMDEKLASLGRQLLPVTLSLFGGYRKDNYASVISLHTKDIVLCLNELCEQSVQYEVEVAEPNNTIEEWVDGMPVSLLKMLDAHLL